MVFGPEIRGLCGLCGHVGDKDEFILAGIAMGMSGDDYELCLDCYNSKSIPEILENYKG